MDHYDHTRALGEPRVAPERAVRLRREMSPPEALLWDALRARRLSGFKFRRQHPLGPYIADFYCHEARLVVEVDGSQHDARREHDRARDGWMHARGLRVLRLSASYVSRDTTGALRTILDAAHRCVRERERGV